MFGYIVANREEMSPEDLLRYRACYCGLCGSLKKRYGEAGRITLTYDMTFLVLVLSSLYEPPERQDSGRCLVHPVKPHLYWTNKFTEYAADMNIALAWHNCMDDWKDDRDVIKFGEAMLLKKEYAEIRTRYPRQCGAIAAGLEELAKIEAENRYDLDAAANCFGEMMAEVFVVEEDRWSAQLRRMSAALGRFIYMMDAYEDVEADAKRGRYNPLIPLHREDGFKQQCEDILRLFIGECAAEFEKLPLVEDVDIMRNILYSGVWTKFVMINAQKEKAGTFEKPGRGHVLAEERN